jgi:hypothetical protein
VTGIILEIHGLQVHLAGLPWGTAHLIMFTLRNERCSADMALILADSLKEAADLIDSERQNAYTAPIRRTEDEIRDLAQFFPGGVNARAPAA